VDTGAGHEPVTAANGHAANGHAAGTGALERLILETAAEVLYLPAGQLGPEHDVVAAGLDSILAVEFIQLLRARAGVELTTERLYATRTARTLAIEMAGGGTVSGGTAAAAEPGPGIEEPERGDQLRGLQDRLRQMAGGCLYLPPEKVDLEAELTAIGLDSVLAVEFVSLANAEFGASLTVETLRDHPTVADLAAYLSLSAATLTAGARR